MRIILVWFVVCVGKVSLWFCHCFLFGFGIDLLQRVGQNLVWRPMVLGMVLVLLGYGVGIVLVWFWFCFDLMSV